MGMAEAAPSLRRLPSRYFVATAAEELPPLAGLMLAAALGSRASNTWLSDWAWPLAGVAIGLRVLVPIYRWCSSSYGMTAEGLWTSNGLLHRRVRFVPWGAMATVDIERPWYCRAVGLVRVNVLQGGDSGSAHSLPGVDEATARTMVERAARYEREESQPAAVSGVPGSRESPVFKASIMDLLIASFVYGKFATLGGAAALVVLEVLQTSGLLESVAHAAVSGPVLAGIAVALAIMVGGFAATVLRFGGLETTANDDAMVLRHGMLSTRERMIDNSAVVGVEIRRSPVEIALGRVRLSLITLDSAGGLGSNLVLPSLREDIAEKIILESFPDKIATHVWRPLSRRHSMLKGASTLGLATMTPTAVALAALALGVGVIYAGAVFLISAMLFYWLGSTLLAELHVDEKARSVSITTSYVSTRQKILDLSSVHVVSTLGVRDRPLILRIHYYSGVQRSLTAVQFDADQRSALSDLISCPANKAENEK